MSCSDSNPYAIYPPPYNVLLQYIIENADKETITEFFDRAYIWIDCILDHYLSIDDNDNEYLKWWDYLSVYLRGMERGYVLAKIIKRKV